MSVYPQVSPNSAYFTRLQGDTVDLTELIDFELPGGTSFRWTTSNHEITYTLSGVLTNYKTFPGMTPGGLQQSNNMQVAAVNFIMQNTGSAIRDLLLNDFAQARIKVGRVFISTPDLGRMEVYNGQVGDFTYNRTQVTGQARNIWKSLNIQWPYYTYMNNCVWRFGSVGCGMNTTSLTVAITSVNVGSSTQLAILCASGMITRSYANDRFDFGRLTVTAGVNSGIVRTIRQHSGDLITLANALPFPDFTGIQLAVFPGCRKRVLEDCKSLYNNDKNFMGFPWITLTPLPRFRVK
jgi:uncharacterized phage protein (TIGR02218 family)